MRLDIPDSLVITGEGAVSLQTEGTKLESAYGYALPQSRVFHRPSMRGLDVLPQVGAKIAVPKQIRAGRGFTADARGRIDHQGNINLEGGGRAERAGWQLASTFGMRGGPGHQGGASSRRLRASVDAGRRLPYRTAGALGLTIRDGVDGVWGTENDLQRSYRRFAFKLAADGVAGEVQLHGSAEFDKRNLDAPSDLTDRGTENGVTLQGYAERAGRQFYVRGRASYDRTSLSRSPSAGGVTTIASAGAEALTRPEELYGGGLGVTLYSVNPFDAVSKADSIRKPYAHAFAWARLAPWLKLTARLGGGGRVERYGLWEAYLANPFVAFNTPLKPTVHRADVDIKFDVQRGEGRHITAGFSYNLVKNYPLWYHSLPSSKPSIVPDFELTYGDDPVSIRTAYITIQHQIDRTIAVSGKLRVFWSTFRDQPDVPYLPAFSHEIASTIDRWGPLRIMPRLTWVGSRKIQVLDVGSSELGGYAVLDIGAQHPLRHGVSGQLWLYNLFHTGYERWEGFREPGLTLALGAVREW